MTRLAIALIAVVACAEPPKVGDTMIALRTRQAHGYGCADCSPGVAMRNPDGCCVDDLGIAWSGCAWDRCGVVEECRVVSDLHLLAATCSPVREWPDCTSQQLDDIEFRARARSRRDAP